MHLPAQFHHKIWHCNAELFKMAAIRHTGFLHAGPLMKVCWCYCNWI